MSDRYKMLTGMLSEIRRAARSVAFRWPQVTTEVDMLQTLFLHFMESPGSVEKLEAMAPAQRVKRLVRIGHDLASRERDALEYFSGQYSYSVEEVKKLLARGVLATRLDAFNAAVHDLRIGVDALAIRNPRQAEAVFVRYAQDGSPNKDVLSRGIESLTTLMNRNRLSEESGFNSGGRFRNSVRTYATRRNADADYFGEGIDE